MGKQLDEQTLFRWIILDKALQSDVPVSSEELCRAYYESGVSNLRGISFRIARKRYAPLLRKDLFQFRTLLAKSDTDVSILSTGTDSKDKRKKGYRYSDPRFSIIPYANNYISDADYRRIDKVFKDFEKVGVLPHDVVNTLRFEVKGRMEFRLKGNNSPVLFDANRKLKGRKWLPIIYDAIRERRIMTVKYVPYGTPADKPYIWRCHPYLLKEYNNRWFLFCFNEKKKDRYWNLAIDRIADIHVEEECCAPPKADYSRRFDGMIGVSLSEYIPGKKPKHVTTWACKNIVLRIDEANAWGRIITKPLHDSQSVVTEFAEGVCPGKVRICVIPNVEFYSRVLGLGQHVSIESPDIIRERMKEIIHGIARQYGYDI